MTKNHKMEHISRDFILTLAHNKGYYNSETIDYGTDLMIRRAMLPRSTTSGGRRYLSSGKAIDIQLKAVHEKYIRRDINNIKYSFEVKNYNDLIIRANEGGTCIPLVLILFVLPNNESDWVECQPNELKTRKEAYWYQVPQSVPLSSNTSKITIEIPLSNKVDIDLFPYLFSILF